MSDTGSSGDNKPQQQDEVNLVSSPSAAAAPEPAPAPEVETKPVTPAKRTPSKRISAVERAQRESEELVKTLGGSLDIEGGRKTRSSTRGTPSRSNVVDTPPPTKKARGASGTPRRPRGRKLDTSTEVEAKTTPEKISSEPESVKEDEEKPAAEAAKTEEKAPEAEPEATETPAVAEEKPSPAKEEEKPEPMEVDGVSKEPEPEVETPTAEHVTESAEKTTEPSEEKAPEEDLPKESDKVVVEQQESSSVVEADEVPAPPAPPAPVEEIKNAVLDNNVGENSIGNNIETNNTDEKVNSLPAEVSPPSPPPAPAPPVPVAGNDHKAESNDFCEPKIASPPITANNDGATPQYCN